MAHCFPVVHLRDAWRQGGFRSVPAMEKYRRNKMRARRALIATLSLSVAGGFVGCATNEVETVPTDDAPAASAGTALSGTLNTGGASTQTAAQEAWRAGFQSANPGVTVNYDPTGSGTGKQNFQQGGYLIAGTDAAYTATEAAGTFASCAPGAALVELPVYISPIALGFNLEGVDQLNLDATTIASIFAGAITTWNDQAIADLNPDATLPDTTITPVHRSDSSGTSENFTDYLNKTAGSVWTWEASQEWPADLAGEAAEKTQGVRETVSSTNGAIGYLDASQAGDLGHVSIKVGDRFVAYSSEAAAAAVEKSPMESGRAAGDVVIALDRTLTDPGAYPMVLVSYAVACSQYADAADGALAKAYLTYVVSPEGQQAAAANAGSAPLSPTLSSTVQAAVEGIK